LFFRFTLSKLRLIVIENYFKTFEQFIIFGYFEGLRSAVHFPQ
jgi:hypothetical protein